MEHELWTLKDVCAFSRFSRSMIYLMVSKGEFPAPMKLGTRKVRWIAEDVRKWLNDKIEQHRAA